MNKGASNRKCSCTHCPNCHARKAKREFYKRNAEAIKLKQSKLNAAIARAKKQVLREEVHEDTVAQQFAYERWNQESDAKRRKEQHVTSSSTLEGWT